MKICYRRNDAVTDSVFMFASKMLDAETSGRVHSNPRRVEVEECVAKASGKTDRGKDKRYIPERVICCNVCNLASTKMKWCKKCKIVRYCSKKCQKIDWKRNNHKRLCKKIRKNGWDKVYKC